MSVPTSARTVAWLALLGLSGSALGAAAPLAADSGAPTVRITSPLGRTGEPGTIRIVAQVAAHSAIRSVTFFVNGTPVGKDYDGPIYAVEWTDDNPFAPSEIAAEVADADGRTARDVVALPAFDFVETAQVSSVLLEATVQDRRGRYVEGLAPGAFSLAESGVAQALDVVRPETMPATYALLVDASQSLSHRVQFLRDAAGRLAGFLRPQDRMLVVPFSKGLGPVTGPTDDRATITEAVAHIEPRGGTAILDALADTGRLIAHLEGRHIIVLVTDGYDEKSTLSYDDALKAVQGSGSTVFAIGVAGVAGLSTRGEQMMKRLATATGGRAFFPWREAELPDVHDRIASDVSKRYLITYTPTNQRIDGSWRPIELRTADASHKVRTKPGYFAPKPPPVRPLLEFMVTSASRSHLSVSRDDLTVLEDGVAQTIDTFQEATAPVSIVMVLDQSGSMKKAATAAVAAARSFVDALRPEDRLGILRFSDSAVLAQDLSTNRSASQAALGEYSATGGTALYDAVHAALARLQRVEGRRVVVVFTDGRDENNAGNGPGSRVALQDVMTELRDSGVVVFPIGLGTNVDRAVLERFATDSGGEAYFPETVDALAGDYARIVENLRRRYTISYTSTNPARDGAWRAVRIGMVDTAAQISSRGGYFAPAQ
jgi:Ca-activated chloride channel family protein